MEDRLKSHIESESEERNRYALQNMFWDATKGRFIPKRFVPYDKLESFIENKNDKIRKWAYYATCFYCNPTILSTAQKNITLEKNELIRSWMLATIYTNDSKTYNNIIKKDVGLSGNTIQLLTHLFERKRNEFSIKKSFLNEIISSENMLEKFWLTFFYKYKPFIENDTKGYRNEIPIQYISALTNLTKTDKRLCEVEEYALAALNMYSPKFSFESDVKFKIEDIEEKDANPRKWAYTLLWKDETLIKNNLDFVQHLMFANNLDVKDREGFAKGLSDNYIFNKDLESKIIEWSLKEENTIITDYLESYIRKYKNQSREFSKQVEDDKQNNSDTNNNQQITKTYYISESIVALQGSNINNVNYMIKKKEKTQSSILASNNSAIKNVKWERHPIVSDTDGTIVDSLVADDNSQIEGIEGVFIRQEKKKSFRNGFISGIVTSIIGGGIWYLIQKCLIE